MPSADSYKRECVMNVTDNFEPFAWSSCMSETSSVGREQFIALN